MRRNLIRALLLDLNNVGENYDLYRKRMPAIRREMSDWLANRFGASNKAIEKEFDCWKAGFGATPLEHHTTFWRLIVEKVTGRRLGYPIVEEIYGRYLDTYGEAIECYPDFRDAIELARDRGWKVGVVANGNEKRVYRFLEEAGVLKMLDVVLASGGTPFVKPDTRLFDLAIRMLGLPAHSVLFVGDRVDTDIKGANQRGMWSVRIKRGDWERNVPIDRFEMPDYEVRGLGEVFALDVTDGGDLLTDAVVAVGGRGRRLGEITSGNQKCLLPVNGVAILDAMLKKLQQVGVERVHLLVSYRAEEVHAYFGSGSEWGLQVIYHKTAAETTAGAVSSILSKLPERFYYLHGNIVLSDSVVRGAAKMGGVASMASVLLVSKLGIAPTHPVVWMSGGTVTGITRNADGWNGEPFYSVGFGLVRRLDLERGVASEGEQVDTTEELLRSSLDSVRVVEVTERWFHLQELEDLEAAGLGVLDWR